MTRRRRAALASAALLVALLLSAAPPQGRAQSVTTLKSVKLSPMTVTGGTTSVTGKVILTDQAPANLTVTLASSNPGVAALPASVLVKAKATDATFTVTTHPVATATTVTVTGTFGVVSKTDKLTVL